MSSTDPGEDPSPHHFTIGDRKSAEEVQQITTDFYNARPDDRGYHLDDQQRAAWKEELQRITPFIPSSRPDGTGRVLDIGAGNGAFAVLLAELGYTVVGIDGAEAVVQYGLQRLASEDPQAQQQITLGVVDWNDPTLPLPAGESPEGYPLGYFDAIFSKQSSCHLYDPIAAFQQWALWLRPDGALIIIDGLWERSGWEGLNGILDELPLSVVSGAGTVTYLVEKGGFRIKRRWLLESVNCLEAENLSGPLFVLVAEKRQSDRG